MIFLDNLKEMMLYKKKFLLPLDPKKKKLGNAVFLLTPFRDSSVNLLNNSLIVPKYYESYYLEKNIMYFIQNQDPDILDECVDMEIINEIFKQGTDKGKEKIKLLFPQFLDKLFKTDRFELNELNRRIPKIEKLTEDLEKEYENFQTLSLEEKENKQRANQAKNIILTLFNICFGPNIENISKLLTDDIQDDIEEFEEDIKHSISTYKRALKFLKKEKKKIEDLRQEKKDYGLNESGLLEDNEDNILNETVILEDAKNNNILKLILYKDRLKKNKEIFDKYDYIKNNVPYIKNTYLTYNRYRRLNLFIDFYPYMEKFMEKNYLKLNKGLDLYVDFLTRFLEDMRLKEYGYKTKYVIIPVHDWNSLISENDDLLDYKDNINPISCMYRLMRTDYSRLQKLFEGFTFIFMGDKSYFKMDFSNQKDSIHTKFKMNINKLKVSGFISNEDNDEDETSKESRTFEIIDSIENNNTTTLKVKNLTGGKDEVSKEVIIKRIEKAAEENKDVESAADDLDNDEEFKKMLLSLSNTEEENINISSARSKRIEQLNKDFLNKKVNNVKVSDLIIDNKQKLSYNSIPKTELKIDSINDEWKDLTYINFEKQYQLDQDIVDIMYSLGSKTLPISIREFTIENTSTSEDYKDTYNFQLEDSFGKRFTFKLDIPKFKDNKFLILKGNEKALQAQMVLLPIQKTEEDTVQIVTDYNKIFIRRYGNKSDVNSDILIKALGKLSTDTQVKVLYGDSSRANIAYELPFDYIETSKKIISIEDENYKFIFNQKQLLEEYKDIIDKDKDKTTVIGYMKKEKQMIHVGPDQQLSNVINTFLSLGNKDFRDALDTCKSGTKYAYSRCSILNNQIPLIVVLAYTDGLLPVLKAAGIQYEIQEKRPKIDHLVQDVIRFRDGYLIYNITLSNSLLMNGLKECNTEDFSISEVNSKIMWLNMLEIFGTRLLADGLENFKDMMLCPKDIQILKDYKLPDNYTNLMIYANELLCDNKFIEHIYMGGKRYRSNELVAAYAYKVISKAYADYKSQIKHNRQNATMTIKQSAVIDAILEGNTTSDNSILNPVLELETINAITSKGPSGMNSDRAYTIEKRGYDDSMTNILGMSTGFAGNAGITRQTTIDMNVEGNRGYFKIDKNKDNMNITKSFTITEALTPFGPTRDDPMRVAMNFVQTSSHQMKVQKSSPLLITSGADEALPYLVTNTFAFKSKGKGTIKEITDEYMIIEYENSSIKSDFVDLRDNVKKNSAGGFYTTIKLDKDDKLKVGSKVSENQIVAYDKAFFSPEVGYYDNIAYNMGTLTKIAILSTDEGFEDSTIITEKLSEHLTSEVVIEKEVVLPKTANIYNIVKVGDEIQEGDPLIVFQNASNDEDIADLLKNITDEELITDLGRIPVQSKITGVVQDIQIFRTVEKEELTESLLKEVNKYEKEQSRLKRVIEKNKAEYPERFNDNTLNISGRLKDTDGVKIIFYLKYRDQMGIGDKLVASSALKGVVRTIISPGDEPYSEYRKTEQIDSLLAIRSVNARMVTSILNSGFLNKILIETSRSVRDILNIENKF